MPTLPNVLMLVQNLPAPADPRVWAEATTLRDAGFQVSIIYPKGRTHQELRVLFTYSTISCTSEGDRMFHWCW